MQAINSLFKRISQSIIKNQCMKTSFTKILSFSIATSRTACQLRIAYDVEKRHKICSNIRQCKEIDSFHCRHSRTRVFHLTISNLELFFVNFNSLEYQITTTPTKPFEEHILKGLNLSIQKLQHLLHSPS